LEAGALVGTVTVARILVVGALPGTVTVARILVVGALVVGPFTLARILFVGASVVVVVVVVVVAVCFTGLPDIGKVCNATIKTTANRNNDDECILVCRGTTMRT